MRALQQFSDLVAGNDDFQFAAAIGDRCECAD
jgi:hypothetical protein